MVTEAGKATKRPPVCTCVSIIELSAGEGLIHVTCVPVLRLRILWEKMQNSDSEHVSASDAFDPATMVRVTLRAAAVTHAKNAVKHC